MRQGVEVDGMARTAQAKRRGRPGAVGAVVALLDDLREADLVEADWRMLTRFQGLLFAWAPRAAMEDKRRVLRAPEFLIEAAEVRELRKLRRGA